MNKVINISKKNNIKEFDALIVGGGGSGMRTSLELAKSGHVELRQFDTFGRIELKRKTPG